MFNSRMSQDLDNYITGHYGEDQFDGEEADPADNGPEVEAIASIRASHPGIALSHDLGFGWNALLFKTYEPRRTKSLVGRFFFPRTD